LQTLLEEVSVGRVIHNGRSASTDLYAETRRLLNKKGIPREAARRGDTLAVDPAVRVQVLSPPRRPSRHGIESKNDASVVLRLKYGKVDLLLPGDVEAAAERDLVRAYGRQLESRVVKIPHHGSETSSTPEFVRAASGAKKDSYAVVSVGQGEEYGMPDREVLSRWKEQVEVRSTARGGAVWMRTDGGVLWEVCWK
jgi:competence protein ComEC